MFRRCLVLDGCFPKREVISLHYVVALGPVHSAQITYQAKLGNVGRRLVTVFGSWTFESL